MAANASSHSQPADLLQTASLLCGLAMLALGVFGVLGNAISLRVFLHRRFRHLSINLLLAALSLSDLCLVLFGVPVFAAAPLSGLIHADKRVSHVLVLYMYPLTMMLQTASVWLLCVITVERYVAVCHPFLVSTLCTRRRAITAAITTACLSVLYNGVRFLEHGVDEQTGQISATLRANSLYILLYTNVLTLLTQYFVPLVLLCALNGRIVLQMSRCTREAAALQQKRATQERRDHKTAKMMLAVVLVFICCYTFSFVLNLVEIFYQKLFTSAAIGFFMSDLNNTLVIFNSASTCLLYAKFSTRYRSQVLAMVLPARGRLASIRTHAVTSLSRVGSWRPSSRKHSSKRSQPTVDRRFSELSAPLAAAVRSRLHSGSIDTANGVARRPYFSGRHALRPEDALGYRAMLPSAPPTPPPVDERSRLSLPSVGVMRSWSARPSAGRLQRAAAFDMDIDTPLSVDNIIWV